MVENAGRWDFPASALSTSGSTLGIPGAASSTRATRAFWTSRSNSRLALGCSDFGGSSGVHRQVTELASGPRSEQAVRSDRYSAESLIYCNYRGVDVALALSDTILCLQLCTLGVQ